MTWRAKASSRELIFRCTLFAASRFTSNRIVPSWLEKLKIPPAPRNSGVSPTVKTGRPARGIQLLSVFLLPGPADEKNLAGGQFLMLPYPANFAPPIADHRAA